MAQPFLAEIRLFSFGFPPKGWAMCNGQLLPINQNQPLFAILGTFYGGNGQTNFALPDLRGRIPIHTGQGFTLGEKAGQEAHTLITSEMPAHNHSIQAVTSDGNQSPVAGNTWGANDVNPYSSGGPNVALSSASVGLTGGSQPHDNMSPYLVINFCIALQGIFPSQN